MTDIAEREAKSRQFLMDVMCSAAEGGCNYWAEFRKVKRDAKLNYLSYEVRNNSADDKHDGWREVTPEKLATAIKRILHGEIEIGRQYAAQFVGFPGNTDICDHDAIGADCAVQAAVFGEIVFG